MIQCASRPEASATREISGIARDLLDAVPLRAPIVAQIWSELKMQPRQLERPKRHGRWGLDEGVGKCGADGARSHVEPEPNTSPPPAFAIKFYERPRIDYLPFGAGDNRLGSLS